jgi:hypothetical protein
MPQLVFHPEGGEDWWLTRLGGRYTSRPNLHIGEDGMAQAHKIHPEEYE